MFIKLPNSPSSEEQNSSEPNGFLANQEILRISLDSKVHCRVHNSQPLFSILRQNNPSHAPNLFTEDKF
jgi:hypothetical protein